MQHKTDSLLILLDKKLDKYSEREYANKHDEYETHNICTFSPTLHRSCYCILNKSICFFVCLFFE